MKKIVALVLSLVMALSLCATAFAATNRVVYSLDGKNVDKTEANAWTLSGVTLEKAETKSPKHIAYYTWTDGVKTVTEDVQCYVAKDAKGAEKWVEKDAIDAAYAKDLARADGTYVELLKVMADKGVENSWKLEDGTFTDDFGGNYKSFAVVIWKNSQNVANVYYAIPCTQDDANGAVYNNGKFENWVMVCDSPALAFYDVTATAQAATTKLPNCTTAQYLEDGYVDADGNYYVVDAYPYKDNDTWLNVNGIIVHATDVTGDDDFFIPASHIFAKGVKNDKMGYDVATCLICKGEFACTNNEAIATKTGYKVSNTFSYSSKDAERVYDANAYANGYDFAWGQAYATDYKFCWALKAGTTEEAGKTTDTTKTGVDSAKTFDAGIAMYVGMSLLSVAGSAVVIGKKKEF